MQDNSFTPDLPALAGKMKDCLSGVGIRLLVHIGSLAIAGIAAAKLGSGIAPSLLSFFYNALSGQALDSLTLILISRFSLFICTYAGLICLFPRGMSRRHTWVIPTATGLAQSVLLLTLGLPWPLSLFWGGLQTWLQRLIQRKGKLGWEWSVAPVLCLSAYSLFSSPLPAAFFTHPVWSVPLLLIVGQAAYAYYVKRHVEPIHRNMLATTQKRLREQLNAKSLPPALEESLLRFTEQIGRFLNCAPRLDKTAIALACQARELPGKLARLSARPDPKGWDSQADKVYTFITRLNADLSEMLAQLPAALQDTGATGERLSTRIAFFQNSISTLRAKQSPLPPNMSAAVEGLAKASENILSQMQQDQPDAPGADKFLARYLPAAHTLLDEYARLAKEGAEHDNVAKVLEQSEETLLRLEKAFVNEHKSFLQNDALNFAADLKVLDTRLKMDGR